MRAQTLSTFQLRSSLLLLHTTEVSEPWQCLPAPPVTISHWQSERVLKKKEENTTIILK